MRNELIEFLAVLFVGDPKTSGIAEAAFFGPAGWFGNSTNSLIGIFRELGVLWHENYDDITAYWIEHYKSDRPDMYIKPHVYNPTTRRGRRKLQVLSHAYPNEWQEKLGLSEDRLETIRHRMEENRTGNLTPQKDSLLEYSQFFDLTTILKKNWTHFQPWLKNQNETIVFLDVLYPFRNELAHRRRPPREDLMLVIGITNRLCERVTKGLLSTS